VLIAGLFFLVDPMVFEWDQTKSNKVTANRRSDSYPIMRSGCEVDW
jgi:hypothetical protein